MDKNPFSHILYEMEMYLYCRDSWEKASKQEDINMAVDGYALHLRNLAVFFSPRIKPKKRDRYWHATDYVCNRSSVYLLDQNLRKQIQNHASQSTCHLLNQRMHETNKQNTIECYQNAFPEVILAIEKYLDAVDMGVLPRYKTMWEDKSIQACVDCIRVMIGAKANATQKIENEP